MTEPARYAFQGEIFSSYDDQDIRIDTPELRVAQLTRDAVTLAQVDGRFDVTGALLPGLVYTLLVSGQNLERTFEEATWTFEFAVSPLPEPSTGGLLGLALLAAARWRPRHDSNV